MRVRHAPLHWEVATASRLALKPLPCLLEPVLVGTCIYRNWLFIPLPTQQLETLLTWYLLLQIIVSQHFFFKLRKETLKNGSISDNKEQQSKCVPIAQKAPVSLLMFYQADSWLAMLFFKRKKNPRTPYKELLSSCLLDRWRLKLVWGQAICCILAAFDFPHHRSSQMIQ